MKILYNENETDVFVNLSRGPEKRGWRIKSDSPEGIYYLAQEGLYNLTKDRDEAAIFENFDNAAAVLEDFKNSIFVEDKRQENIVHFLHVEKIEDYEI